MKQFSKDTVVEAVVWIFLTRTYANDYSPITPEDVAEHLQCSVTTARRYLRQELSKGITRITSLPSYGREKLTVAPDRRHLARLYAEAAGLSARLGQKAAA